MFCKCGSDRQHHKLLHHPYKKNKGYAEQEPRSGKHPQKPPAQSDPHVVPVKGIAPNGSALTTYGLLDNASRGTIISSHVASTLGIKRGKRAGTCEHCNGENQQGASTGELQSASGVGEIITVEEELVSGTFNISERWLPKYIDKSFHPLSKGHRDP